MPKMILTLDTRVSGLETRKAVIQSLRDRDVDVQAAEPTFDGINDKPVEVIITFPDSASQIAEDVAAANPGVVGTPIALPDPLFMFDLENMVLATLVVPNKAFLTCLMVLDAFALRSALGRLAENNTYEDININDRGHPFGELDLTALSGFSWTLPASDLTLTFDGGATIVLANQNPLLVDATNFTFARKKYYIDIDGKMYLGSATSATENIPPRTYEQAVRAGAV